MNGTTILAQVGTGFNTGEKRAPVMNYPRDRRGFFGRFPPPDPGKPGDWSLGSRRKNPLEIKATNQGGFHCFPDGKRNFPRARSPLGKNPRGKRIPGRLPRVPLAFAGQKKDAKERSERKKRKEDAGGRNERKTLEEEAE
jgi:hypothetical protein